MAVLARLPEPCARSLVTTLKGFPDSRSGGQGNGGGRGRYIRTGIKRCLQTDACTDKVGVAIMNLTYFSQRCIQCLL